MFSSWKDGVPRRGEGLFPASNGPSPAAAAARAPAMRENAGPPPRNWPRFSFAGRGPLTANMDAATFFPKRIDKRALLLYNLFCVARAP